MCFISKLNYWLISKESELSAWSSVIMIISFPLIIIGLVVGYFQLKDIFTLPDVELNFVHPQSISYQLVNSSSKIAENILVSFGIFDLDSNPSGPLPIPSIEYDYVNKESEKGPFTLLHKFAKENHRYFGIVYVGCKGCNRLRTYWLFVKHGSATDSFYAERNESDIYEINIHDLVNNTEKYLKGVIPEHRRILLNWNNSFY